MRMSERISGMLCVAALLLGVPSPASPQSPDLPHLEHRGAATQLIVDRQPFLVLGGETRNSSSSSPAYMDPVWPRSRR